MEPVHGQHESGPPVLSTFAENCSTAVWRTYTLGMSRDLRERFRGATCDAGNVRGSSYFYHEIVWTVVGAILGGALVGLIAAAT